MTQEVQSKNESKHENFLKGPQIIQAILQSLYYKRCKKTAKNCVPHRLNITHLMDAVSKIMGTKQTNPKMHYFGEILSAAKMITIDEGTTGVIFELTSSGKDYFEFRLACKIKDPNVKNKLTPEVMDALTALEFWNKIDCKNVNQDEES